MYVMHAVRSHFARHSSTWVVVISWSSPAVRWRRQGILPRTVWCCGLLLLTVTLIWHSMPVAHGIEMISWVGHFMITSMRPRKFEIDLSSESYEGTVTTSICLLKTHTLHYLKFD